jgi:hypothetical protein
MPASVFRVVRYGSGVGAGQRQNVGASRPAASQTNACPSRHET